MKILLLISLVCFFTSCSMVYFEEPQPAGKKNIDELPKKLHGAFMSQNDDGTKLVINKDQIHYFHADEKEINLKLNKNLIVKKYKGEYYVNVKDEDNHYWGLYLLVPAGKKLIMKSSSLNDDNLEKFQTITNIKAYHSPEKDVKEYILNPTLKQLKNLMKDGFFMEADTLVKM